MVKETDNEMINKLIKNLIQLDINKRFDWEKYFNDEFFKKKIKRKEYDYNGNLLFEGEYLNGERNGKGKEYDYNGQLKFEGEYLKDYFLLKFNLFK